jgi:hypothetical protein
MLEAIGITPRSKKGWADMAARFGRSLTLSADAADESGAQGVRRRRR